MEHSTAKKSGILSGVIISVFLLGVSFSANKADAAPVNAPANGHTQLAWWVGGWGPGWYHGGYYRGWNNYYRGPMCNRHCWRNRWGYVRCAGDCY